MLTEPQKVQKLFSLRPMQTTLMSDTCKQKTVEQKDEGEDGKDFPVLWLLPSHSWLAQWQQAVSCQPLGHM